MSQLSEAKIVVPTQLLRSLNNSDEVGSTNIEKSKLERSELEYTPLYQRFLKKDVRFTTQFSHIYLNRLLKCRPLIIQEAKKNWPESRLVQKIIDIAAGDEVVAIGTLYKEQTLKPNILDEFSHEFDGGQFVQEERANYCSEDDVIVIEDESGRMHLTGFSNQEEIDQLVTGVVAGVKGELLQTGDFKISGLHDICYPSFSDIQNAEAEHKCGSGFNAKYLMLISGLEAGGSRDPLRIQLLVDYILGHIADIPDHNLQKDIVRVVLAGNSCADISLPYNDASEKIDITHQKSMTEAISQLDITLSELASSIPVDIMPGETDPSTFTLPQQPLQGCLFPTASRFSTFKTVTNPYDFKINGVQVTGHSGQPVNDLKKYTRGLSSLELMKKTLIWRHMAPTSPDTLACYPFTKSDPFFVSNLPSIYFSGNQEKFDSTLFHGTRIITVPNFSETGLAVLVNLNSPQFDCFVISVNGLDAPLN